MTTVQDERKRLAQQVIDKLRARAGEVLSRYPVLAAYLHGSMGRGVPLPTSDIDVAIVFDAPLSSHERFALELAIQAELEDTCGLSNLDVRAVDQAPIMVKGKIVQEGILLYERDRRQRIAFEVLTRKMYFDYKPTAERMQRAFLAHLRQKGLR